MPEELDRLIDLHHATQGNRVFLGKALLGLGLGLGLVFETETSGEPFK